MILKRSLTLLLMAVFYGQMALAQQQPANSVEINLQTVISKFTSRYQLVGHAYGGEVILHLNKENAQIDWMRQMKLKSIDIVYNYKQMNTVQLDYYPYNGIFADSHALLAGLQIELIKLKGVELLLSPAVGVAYVNETYYTNRNPVLSSHLNVALRGAVKIVVPISTTLQLSSSLDIYHYSNGAYRVANNGMNLASFGVGLSKNIGSTVKSVTNNQPTEQATGGYLDVGLDIGRRGIFRSKKGVFRNGLYLGYGHHLNSIFVVAGGVDAVYYHTVFDPENYDYTHQSFGSSYDRVRVGASIGTDIWMGKLAAVFRFGRYIHYNSLTDTKSYWTGGLRYALNNWASVQGKIYLHGTEADYLGFGFIVSRQLAKK